MKTKIVLLVGLALLGFSFASAQGHRMHGADMQKSEQGVKAVYSCPMHIEVVSDKPGKCPKCGMKLEKQTAKGEMSLASMMGNPAFERSVQGV